MNARDTDLCSDCPPVGYPTDETRCDECPRSQANRIEARAAEIYEAAFVYESVETASWAAALELGLTSRIDSCRAQAKAEIEASAPVIPLRPASKLRKPLNYDHTTALVSGILMQSLKARR